MFFYVDFSDSMPVFRCQLDERGVHLLIDECSSSEESRRFRIRERAGKASHSGFETFRIVVDECAEPSRVRATLKAFSSRIPPLDPAYSPSDQRSASSGSIVMHSRCGAEIRCA